jgi:hypothetical protein
MTGLLFNSKETQSLTYSCSLPSNGVITCNFTQTAVRPKLTKADAEKAVQQVKDQVRKSGAVFSQEECNTFSQMLEILEGRATAPKPEALAKLSPLERRDASALAKASVQACKSKSEADALAVLRVSQDKDFRTCRVSSHGFTQSFKRSPPSAGGQSAWIAQGTPEGPCGTVQLSRFEYEKSTVAGIGFWNYIARKAITNPKAVWIPGSPPTMCSALDQDEYPYTWNRQEHALGCDYIEFSPL